jgi:cell division protein FtsW
MKVEENFGRLLGTGIILLFITQAIMNVAVVMGLLPTTGINLPLISYGGTSVLSYMAMFGILLNILKSNKAVGNL